METPRSPKRKDEVFMGLRAPEIQTGAESGASFSVHASANHRWFMYATRPTAGHFTLSIMAQTEEVGLDEVSAFYSIPRGIQD